jgi:uncharacterized protein (TIGR02996 family)
MSSEAAFLEAIREEPGEDSHRLVYADWLEEHSGAGGAARAEFIRFQCRLADPTLRGRRKRKDRAEDLLDQHRAEWLGPLRNVPQNWRFRRGFIESFIGPVSLFLQHAEKIFRVAPVRHVRLKEDVNGQTLAQLARCPHLVHLRELELRENQLSSTEVAPFAELPYLERLTALDMSGTTWASRAPWPCSPRRHCPG